MKVFFFDTETTGLPMNKYPPNSEMQPHITQLGGILEIDGTEVVRLDALIKPDNWRIHECSGTGISAKSTELTGITIEMCEEHGIPIEDAMEIFMTCMENADIYCCHNTSFDRKIVGFEFNRLYPDVAPRHAMRGRPGFCTMKAATPICEIPKKNKKTAFKWPTLAEAMKFFFDEELENAHSAIVDIAATRRLFHEIMARGGFEERIMELADQGRLDPDYGRL